ncbi:MAG: hypothetical protein GXO32_03430 [Crenarchaeota archaeon]|nr:hypothetical protein [Thermoproteota archaeon]
MFVIVKRVRDLNKFIDFLRRECGLEIVEGSHAVLPDGSEVGTWCGARDGKFVVCFTSHYIDKHYDALRKLPPDADDVELLRVLIEADRDVWRAPVEPVVVIGLEDWVARPIARYDDSAPSEGAEALRHFEESAPPSARTLLGSLVSRFAYASGKDLRRLVGYEP